MGGFILYLDMFKCPKPTIYVHLFLLNLLRSLLKKSKLNIKSMFLNR